jgi:hypothetical protein
MQKRTCERTLFEYQIGGRYNLPNSSRVPYEERRGRRFGLATRMRDDEKNTISGSARDAIVSKSDRETLALDACVILV